MPQTTMILKNARIYTMDGRIAEAAAITGDRIAKVGSNPVSYTHLTLLTT